MVPKGEITFFINSYHNPLLDTIFIAFTWIGEGYFIVFMLLSIILFYNIYQGLIASGTMIITGLVVQGLKRLIFEDALRPSAYLEEASSLYYVDGLQIHSMYSFPSGHTTGAFALFTLLALMTLNKRRHFFFFFIAFLVGLSRLYLVQHFFMDTYFGSLLGMSVALICYLTFTSYIKIDNSSRLNRPLLSRVTRNEDTAHIH